MSEKLSPQPEEMYQDYRQAVDRKIQADADFVRQSNPETRSQHLSDEGAQHVIAERDRATTNLEVKMEEGREYAAENLLRLTEQAQREAEVDGVQINLGGQEDK